MRNDYCNANVRKYVQYTQLCNYNIHTYGIQWRLINPPEFVSCEYGGLIGSVDFHTGALTCRSVYKPGMCTNQECVLTRNVYKPGMCTNQECVLTRSVY